MNHSINHSIEFEYALSGHTHTHTHTLATLTLDKLALPLHILTTITAFVLHNQSRSCIHTFCPTFILTIHYTNKMLFGTFKKIKNIHVT